MYLKTNHQCIVSSIPLLNIEDFRIKPKKNMITNKQNYNETTTTTS